jgi:hypothetical protein
MNDDPARRYVTISLDCPDGEVEGVIWVESAGADQRAHRFLVVGERVQAYLDELEDGGSVELRFTRIDLTRAQIAALPET